MIYLEAILHPKCPPVPKLKQHDADSKANVEKSSS